MKRSVIEEVLPRIALHFIRATISALPERVRSMEGLGVAFTACAHGMRLRGNQAREATWDALELELAEALPVKQA